MCNKLRRFSPSVSVLSSGQSHVMVTFRPLSGRRLRPAGPMRRSFMALRRLPVIPRIGRIG